MRYIAFFRGINVGGKNIVKMASLKQLFCDIGFEAVQTYIQSGNVIFETDKSEEDIFPMLIKAFTASFGFACAVMLRTADEVMEIAQNMPFTGEELAEAAAANPDVEHVYVYMADGEPNADELANILAHYSGEDKVLVKRREIYLLCQQSIRDSKLAGALAKLKMPLTARNLKTINNLCALLCS